MALNEFRYLATVKPGRHICENIRDADPNRLARFVAPPGKVLRLITDHRTMLFAAGVMLVAPLVSGNFDAWFRLLFLACPLVAAAWYIWRESGGTRRDAKKGLPHMPERLLVSLVLLIAASMGLLSHLIYPVVHLALVFALGCAVIAYSVATAPPPKESHNTKVGLALFSSLNGLFLYFVGTYDGFFFGQRDMIFHLGAVSRLLSVGHADPGTLKQYADFPAFHIAAAIFSRVLSVDAYGAMTGFILCAFLLVPTFIYLFVEKVTSNKRVALMAAMIASAGTSLGALGVYTVPLSLSVVYFLLVLALLSRSAPRSLLTLATLPVIVAWILTHQISLLIASIVVAILGSASLRGRSIESQRLPRLSILVIIGVTTVGYWVTSATFFPRTMGQVIQALLASAGTLSTTSPLGGTTFGLGFFVDHLGLCPVIFLLAIFMNRSFRNIENQDNSFLKTLAAGTILLAIVYFPNPVWLTSPVMLLDLVRWGPLIVPLIVVGLALGLGTVQSRPGNARRALVSVFVVTLAIGATSLSPALLYNTALSTQVITGYAVEKPYFSPSELSALRFMLGVPNPKSSDSPSGLWLSFIANQSTMPLVLENGRLLLPSGFILYRFGTCIEGGLVVVNSKQVGFGGGILVPAEGCMNPININGSSVIYDSGTTDILALEEDVSLRPSHE